MGVFGGMRTGITDNNLIAGENRVSAKTIPQHQAREAALFGSIRRPVRSGTGGGAEIDKVDSEGQSHGGVKLTVPVAFN